MTAVDRGLYDELGVEPSATDAEIRSAYRKKAKGAHPDGGGSAEAFSALARTQVILLDPLARKRYDETGHAEESAKVDIQAQAMSIVEQTLVAYVAAPIDFDTVDLVKLLREQISTKRAEFKQAIKAMQAQIAKHEKTAKRITAKRGKPNLLAKMLARKIGELQAAQAANGTNVEIADAALEIVKAHDYQMPQPELKPGQQFYSGETNRNTGSLNDAQMRTFFFGTRTG